MSAALLALHLPPRRPAEGCPAPSPSPLAFSIWGHAVVFHIWTAEEWAALKVKPRDARRAPNGCRVAARVA